MDKEPSVIIGLVTGALTAAIGLALAFGLDISDAQRDAMIGCVAAFVPLILIMVGLIRQLVYAPTTVQKYVDTAKEAGETNSPAPVVEP